MSTILVIEDNQDNFDLIADALGDAHNLAHARTGPDGMRQAENIKPDLILLDIGLPDRDGLEVARHLKADISLADTPVVALTAHAMSGDRERCVDAGCDDYMSKPINVRELLSLVEQYLNAKEDPIGSPPRNREGTR